MKVIIAILILLNQAVHGQQLRLKNVGTTVDATFRGLSVVDDEVAWVSGTKGTVGRSTDGGRTWRYDRVEGFEKSDFRSLYAFDSLHAVMASTGGPAVILHTSDGGHQWDVVYKSDDTTVFFDGIDFWNNKEGMIYGDPINKRMLLLCTKDGGRSWKALPGKSRPELEEGEASFAASGTGIRCLKNNKLVVITGGKESRFFISENKGLSWDFVRSPIIKGQSTAGMFSVAYRNDTAVVVGGDYKNDTLSKDNVYVLLRDSGRFTWKKVTERTRGYRECVELISDNTLVATGPMGTDITEDMGMHWKPLSDERGYHVIRKSRKGNQVIAAGSKGQIARLVCEK